MNVISTSSLIHFSFHPQHLLRQKVFIEQGTKNVFFSLIIYGNMMNAEQKEKTYFGNFTKQICFNTQNSLQCKNIIH